MKKLLYYITYYVTLLFAFLCKFYKELYLIFTKIVKITIIYIKYIYAFILQIYIIQ